MIASLSKLIYEARGQLGVRLDPRAVRIEYKSEKRYKELIEENFQKPLVKGLAAVEEEKVDNEEAE